MSSKDIRSSLLDPFAAVEYGFIYGENQGTADKRGRITEFIETKTLKQVHSDRVIIFDDHSSESERQEGDALITSLRNICIGVFTADCVPVLLYDPVGEAVGVVHAGWRGTSAGITGKTVRMLADHSCGNTSGVTAVLGPCICGSCYEVDRDVADIFLKSFTDCSEYLAEAADGKYLLDLAMANIVQLREAGVTSIEVIQRCTSCNELLPSYRRDGKGTGRMFTYIGIV